jgi:hypothetical protein
MEIRLATRLALDRTPVPSVSGINPRVGTTKVIFAVFATAFPLIVLAVFVWLLLRHPGNLYSPDQNYVGVLTRENNARMAVFGEAVVTTVAENLDDEPSASQADIRRRFKGVLGDALERSTITIDRSLVGQGVPSSSHGVTVDDSTTIADFLDSVYYALENAVSPYTYGEEWILRDQHGDYLHNIGSTWGSRRYIRGEPRERDTRKLGDIGIQPGRTLHAEMLSR